MENDGVFRLSELPPLPEVKAHRIGILDEHYRVRFGDMAVLTGLPGMGKSALLTDICSRLVEKYGMAICFASFEQTPQRDHRRALRTWYIEKLEIHMTEQEMDSADAWINKNFSFIVPEWDDDVTVPWLLTRAATSVRKHGVKVLVVDPFNEMDHAYSARDISLTQYVGNSIKAFKKFARQHDVHVIIAAHPAKQKKNDDNSYNVPTLGDISDSQNWWNKPDVGVIIHRVDDRTLVRIAKSRYHSEIGTPGDVFCTFDMSTGKFTEVPG